MNILVCIKQVPGTSQVEIDEKTGTLKRDGVAAKMNPFDLYALETALRIKEKCEGQSAKDEEVKVTVLTMGPPQCEKVVREAFMMGVDRGVILSDRAFGGADVLMTSYTLAQGVKASGPVDLIICGKQTTDGDTAQVGAELAEWLNIPHVVNVKAIGGECAFHGNAPTDGEGGSLKCDKESGCSSANCTAGKGLVVTVDLPDYEIVERIPYPFLMTVEKGIFEPRLPSYRKKLATADREITWLALGDLPDKDPKHYGLNGSPTQVKRIFPPEAHVEHVMLEGEPEAQAAQLADLLESKKFLQ